MKKIIIIVKELPENFMVNAMEEKEVTVTGIVEEILFMDKGSEKPTSMTIPVDENTN